MGGRKPIGFNQQLLLTTLQSAGGALAAAVLLEQVGGRRREMERALNRLVAAGLVLIEGKQERLQPGDLVVLAAEVGE